MIREQDETKTTKATVLLPSKMTLRVQIKIISNRLMAVQVLHIFEYSATSVKTVVAFLFHFLMAHI